jgi:hypothetical protein
MQIFHHEAIKNETYLRDCYDDFDIIKNKGWLTLVILEYFEFGRDVLTRIRTKCNQKKLGELGNSCIKMAKETFLEVSNCKLNFLNVGMKPSSPTN